MSQTERTGGGVRAEQVAALRLFTSSSFKQINEPLRDGRCPHPFKATVFFLTEALKKLRAVAAEMDPKGFNTVGVPVVLSLRRPGDPAS